MLRVKRIEVEGLAGRKAPVVVEFNEDVTILFGQNGCGKTSLLKLIHCALSDEIALLENVMFKKASVTFTHDNYEGNLTRTLINKDIRQGEMFYFTDENSSARAWLDKVVSPRKWMTNFNIPQDRESSFDHQYLSTFRLYIDYYGKMMRIPKLQTSSSDLDESNLDKLFADRVNRIWDRFMMAKLNTASNIHEKGLQQILKTVLNPRTDKSEDIASMPAMAAYTKMEKFLKRRMMDSVVGDYSVFQKLYGEDPQLKKIVSLVCGVEDEISDTMKQVDQLEELLIKMLSNNKKIVFDQRRFAVKTNAGEEIGLHVLSSGEKHLIKILTASLLAKDSAIIIDEPELSLHPDWQKPLLGYMLNLNRDAQIIVATHSPEIMSDYADDKIRKI